MRYVVISVFAVALVSASAHAQTSTSFKLTESVFNAGGDPQNGASAASASFHIKLDAIGDAVASGSLASASFHSGSGFVSGYPPPGEVQSLRFADKTTMNWSPEPSIGAYEVYRGTLASLPSSFGSCFAAGTTSELSSDSGSPAIGQGWLYLVTARNRLGEEGTKGTQTGGAERPNSFPCP